MRDLNIEEVEAVSGAVGPDVGIASIIGILGTAAAIGAATPIVLTVGFGAIAVMGLIAAGQSATQSAGPDKKGGGS